MPLGETLTLLATLANAYQALRFNRSTETAHEAEPVIDSTTLVALEAARTANGEALQRHESGISHLHGLLTQSCLILPISAFLGAVSDDSPEGESPLFIASLCCFAAVIVGVIAVRRTTRVSRISLEDFPSGQGPSEWETMQRVIEQARAVERRNSARLELMDLATDLLILGVALQAILAALWLIS